MNISCVHSLRDKCNHCKPKPQWILDSGASMHFFPKRNDFVEYTAFLKKDLILIYTTASNIHIIGISKYIVPWRDSNKSLQHLMLVGIGHIPNSGVCLVSMGQLLDSGIIVQGNRSSIHILYGDGMLLAPFTPLPCFKHNMYTLKVASPQHKAHTITYDMMHKQLGHPSKDVLKHVHNHAYNFSSSIEFLKEDTICPGFVKGKISAHTYHPDSHHASKPFELIYSDIKSFPILSYYKYLYIITFFDDFISCGWSAMLHTKSATLQAAKCFLSMVSIQYDAKVKDGCPIQGESTDLKFLISFLLAMG